MYPGEKFHCSLCGRESVAWDQKDGEAHYRFCKKAVVVRRRFGLMTFLPADINENETEGRRFVAENPDDDACQIEGTRLILAARFARSLFRAVVAGNWQGHPRLAQFVNGCTDDDLQPWIVRELADRLDRNAYGYAA